MQTLYYDFGHFNVIILLLLLYKVYHVSFGIILYGHDECVMFNRLILRCFTMA